MGEAGTQTSGERVNGLYHWACLRYNNLAKTPADYPPEVSSLRLISICLVVAAGLLSVAPAHAATHIVTQKTSKKFGTVILRSGLAPGHLYRIQVLATGHRAFSGQGFEYYTYVSNHRLFTQSKPIALSGKTPQSFQVGPPTSHGMTEWILAVSVALTRGNGLTVRILDVGSKK